VIPSSIKPGEITLVLREGYDPELLNQGFRTMITQLNLELLFIDTYPGVNEETLLWNAISEIENTMHEASMNIEFTGKIWYWRGPAPFYFVTVPAEGSGDIKAISNLVTYGWGVIPVHARIGETEWQTSLFPKEGLYLVPLKDAIRKAEKLVEGDDVTIRLEIRW